MMAILETKGYKVIKNDDNNRWRYLEPPRLAVESSQSNEQSYVKKFWRSELPQTFMVYGFYHFLTLFVTLSLDTTTTAEVRKTCKPLSIQHTTKKVCNLESTF